MLSIYSRFFFVLIGISCMFLSCDPNNATNDQIKGRNYYVSTSGSDSNSGTMDSPWKSIAKLNTLNFDAGDVIHLESGQAFDGTLQLDSADSGTLENPVVVTSSTLEKASIHAGNSSAIMINGGKYITVRHLHLIGSGRKDGNTESGMVVQHNSKSIRIDSLEIEGFQKSGLLIFSSTGVVAEKVHAHNNGAAGISVSGESKNSYSRNISIRHCLAENNPGDPTNLDNHSGNGIIIGLSTNVMIEYCAATNNGWDMPRIGNGPVGIWAYEADSIVIQHCISYRNKTAKGAEDGGGFDLDGGVTNSVIQYCLSYENEGSGFGIFQYFGASPWRNNIVRFNISENDGQISRAHSGVFIWNGSDDENQFTDFYFYNNVIYSAMGTAIHFDVHSNRKRFYYYNNIFIAKDDLTKGLSRNDTFTGNNWWNLSTGFNMGGIKNFSAWVKQTGQEMTGGEIRGFNVDPGFDHAASTVTSPLELPAFIKYKLSGTSPLGTQGLDLKAEKSIERGGIDFNQNPLPLKGIGASF